MLLKAQSIGFISPLRQCGGREIGFLHRCLEGVNGGPLGIGDHRGLPDTIQGGASADLQKPSSRKNMKNMKLECLYLKEIW